MILSIASRRASPGATTFASMLAGMWGEAGTLKLLVEADDTGGSLAARWSAAYQLTTTPGLIELATLSEAPDTSLLVAHSQPVATDVGVVPAPPAPGQVINAINALGDDGIAALASIENLRAFVDCGRLTSRSAALQIARRSLVTILVARPILEEIHSLQAGIVELREAGCNVGLVLVGKGDWPASEIAEHARVPLLGVLPDDPKGAKLIAQRGLAAGRSFDRSSLGKAMAEVVPQLQNYCSVKMRPVDENAPFVTSLSRGAQAASGGDNTVGPSSTVGAVTKIALGPLPGQTVGSRNGHHRQTDGEG